VALDYRRRTPAAHRARPDLSFSENFFTCFGEVPEPAIVRLDVSLILYAEHSFNARPSRPAW
jgi:citrate synthase